MPSTCAKLVGLPEFSGVEEIERIASVGGLSVTARYGPKWKWKTTDKAWTVLKPRVRRLRTEATEAEDRLWAELRGRKLQGARFRRQHTISHFIVDFYCGEARLVIEVDGPIHDDRREEDAQRQAILESQGFCVLRFTNAEVERKMASVLCTIGKALAARIQVKSS